MSELEIVLGIACAVLFVAWRYERKMAGEHYEAACIFKTALYKVAKKEASLNMSADGEHVQVKITDQHKPIEL
jgi:hypothetical protein